MIPSSNNNARVGLMQYSIDLYLNNVLLILLKIVILFVEQIPHGNVHQIHTGIHQRYHQYPADVDGSASAYTSICDGFNLSTK
jgi:hypothetical protein